MDIKEKALKAHEEWGGKIEVISRAKVENKDDLSIAYTPGVAEPCLKISDDVSLSYKYTRRSNMVAVITDGTAVLGLGDIGPEAGMPCGRTKDVEEIVFIVEKLAGSFGGVNLEDISAPRCFEIEKKLKEKCDIPIFHDDQHGTAIVTLAAMMNALKYVKKDISEIEVVVNGSGAAGIAITKLLMSMGLKKVILCDTKGAIYKGRDNLNPIKAEMAEISNLELKKGKLADVIVGADVFIGVSAPGSLTPEMVKTMAKDPIVFAMANPTPEIMPELAKEAGVKIMGTGRSDFPNQINNVLAFPGIFRGAFDAKATDINDEMKIAAAKAIAGIIKDEEITPEYVIPAAFDERVAPAVAKAVAEAAKRTGVCRD